jgi:hypothetical protein
MEANNGPILGDWLTQPEDGNGSCDPCHPCVLPSPDPLKTPASVQPWRYQILELLLRIDQGYLDATTTTHIAMASVYKTISASSGQEKESGERKNKQRVLILVCDRHELTCRG